jgi:hypothetical protein
VYERLGDAHSLLRGRRQLGTILLERAGQADRKEAQRLLYLARDEARRMKLPEAQQIEEIMEESGLGPLPREDA